ncbi:glucose-1-phosphate thymidylyltransferase [Aliifodinibius salipaludis]|uniref:Glucose-1-phosphate thymidylyltransferase n=1 Tax=Fodinibius salipaludis TaxID=2032627 RepID=A0A2A2GDD9_9BACT|nr:sugar phosphate nucleotidyltransferase [Aliifodinibius salipaludis]PAU94865.1 glucose-1-phosphate thymidylyltransferase [Aliifodinibius salipaludis]
MKLIIPMAGRGTRVRPHSHTVPKPLLPVAGKMIVERIVETFARTLDRNIDEIVFILGPDFGQEIKDALKAMSDRQNAKATFRVQEQAEGTAHAVYCAEKDLDGECIIVFADTIFDMEGSVSIEDADSVVWLKEVEDPSRFGVAVEKDGKITDFVEKPDEPISNLAIIGVYYFKDGAELKKEIEYLLDNDIRGKGNEFQLTDALDRLLKDNKVFKKATVDQWLDCGTLPAWRETSGIITEKEYEEIDEDRFPGTKIIPPVYIGDDVELENCIIGPKASIAEGSTLKKCTVKNSLVQEHATLEDCNIEDSTIGRHVELKDVDQEVHLGDHTKIGVEV